MNPIFVMSKHELRKKITEKWYILTTLLVLIIILTWGKLPATKLALAEKPEFLKTTLAVFDQDNTSDSQYLVSYVEEYGKGNYRLIFNEKKYDIALIIPEGFSDSLRVYNATLVLNFTNYKDSLFATSVGIKGGITGILVNFTMEFVESEIAEHNLPKKALSPIYLETIQAKIIPNVFPFLILFMIFGYASVASTSIRREKDGRTFELLASAPISYQGIFLSKVLTYSSLFLIQFFVWSLGSLSGFLGMIHQLIFVLPAIIFFTALYIGLSALATEEEGSHIIETLVSMLYFGFLFIPIKESMKLFFLLFPLTSAITMIRVMIMEMPSIFMLVASLMSSVMGMLSIVWFSVRLFKRKIMF